MGVRFSPLLQYIRLSMAENIHLLMSKKYNQADIEFVRQNYANTSNDDIALHINRTNECVRKLAGRLGLKKSREHIARVKSQAGSIQFVVFDGMSRVFEGIGKDAAIFCGCAASSITRSAQSGKPLRGKYVVVYAHDKKSINDIVRSHTRAITETMDWPLWFFKAGVAPSYAKFYDGSSHHK